MTTNKSHLTAISRKKLSAPMYWLLDKELLGLYVLDYGCGKGTDADILSNEFGYYCEKYDPYYDPDEDALSRHHDVVTCHYVLNVLNKEDREEVINKLLSLDCEHIYVTVRRDIKEDFKTKRGTEQYVVNLDYPIVKETSGFCIYKVK